MSEIAERKLPETKDEAERVTYISLDDVPNGHTDDEHFAGWADTNDPGTWVQPMRMDADTDNAVAHWLLARMNGEEPKIRLTTLHQICAAKIQFEIWSQESEGELDIGLERLFDLLPAELSRKADSCILAIDRMNDEEKLQRRYAATHTAKARANSKAVEWIKEHLSHAMRQHGMPGEGTNGKINYHVNIPRGKVTCYRHHADKVIFPKEFKTDARIALGNDITVNFGDIAGVECLLLAVPVEKLPLSPELLNVSIEAKPNLDACRSAEPGNLPEGTRKEENWIVKSPSSKGNENE